MAPAVWTAERNERLLLLVLAELQLPTLDPSALCKKWIAKYGGVDDYKPTERGLKDQLAALKKKAGASATGKKVAATISTPKAASRALALPKTPTSSAKRRLKSMSEDDDSEAEREVLKELSASVTKRQRTSRSLSTKRYTEPVSEAEDEEDDQAKLDRSIGYGANGESTPHANGDGDDDDEMDAMSEVSDFKPYV